MRNVLDVPAQEVRLPQEAVNALAAGRAVAVTRYGRRQHVVLSKEQFELVEPLLELLEEGASVSPELLMTKADIDLMTDLAEDREVTDAEAEHLDDLLAERD
ncbi:MAG TPA: hypothetical protein VE570_03275 [Thermoleophilaceae bacterium]|jgi:PHD/YefM family antitoxin component YafN of YafNO toxin-antitoxin module|nr:hypothetical protein [Thermoleophilaceae bacterium]